MPELKPCRKAFGLDRHNSFFNGCSRWPKHTKDEDYDWESAWIDNGPSPAGNDGPYVKLPYRPDDTIHRIYPKQSAWRVFAKAVAATYATRPDGGDSTQGLEVAVCALEEAERRVNVLRYAVSPNGPNYVDGVIDAVNTIRNLIDGPTSEFVSDVSNRLKRRVAPVAKDGE